MIPDEVMLRCIGYLCPVDIARLVATCRRFNNCWLNCGGSMWYDDLDGKKSVPSEWKWLSVVCRGPVGAHSKTEGLLSPTVSLEICPHLLEIRIDFREHLEYCSGVAWDFGDPSKTPSLCVMRLRVCFTSQQDVDTASRFGILSFRYSSEPLQALVLWCETADDSSEARQGAANCLIDSLFWGANRVLCTWGNENDRSVGAAHLRDAIPRAFPAERQCSSFTCPNLEMVFWRAEQVPGGLMCDLTEISSLESLFIDIHRGSVPRGWCAWSLHAADGGCRATTGQCCVTVYHNKIHRLHFRLRSMVSMDGDDFVCLWDGILRHMPYLGVLRIDLPFDCIGDTQLHQCARSSFPHRLRSVNLCLLQRSDQRAMANPPTAGAAHLFDQLKLCSLLDETVPLQYTLTIS